MAVGAQTARSACREGDVPDPDSISADDGAFSAMDDTILTTILFVRRPIWNAARMPSSATALVYQEEVDIRVGRVDRDRSLRN